jgi:hypothetical protein
MKPRHAAALALVGWYLMMPPHQNVSRSCGDGDESDAACLSYFIDPNTPLRKWQRVPDTLEFEYKTDCQHAIADGCHREVEGNGESYLGGRLCYVFPDCIATDDPRLKEN